MTAREIYLKATHMRCPFNEACRWAADEMIRSGVTPQQMLDFVRQYIDELKSNEVPGCSKAVCIQRLG
jgi:hypothetical protein